MEQRKRYNKEAQIGGKRTLKQEDMEMLESADESEDKIPLHRFASYIDFIKNLPEA